MGSTCPEPPPESTPASACDPMTAIEWMLRCGQRQLAVRVLQQHDGLFGDALGHFEAVKHIRHAAIRRVIVQPHRKLAAQHPVHHVVEARHGNLAALDRFLESGAEVIGFRHLHVQAGVGRLGGAMRGAPVGDDEALEAEILFQSLVQQIVVLAGVIAVDQVVGAHHRAHVGQLHARSQRPSRSLSRMARLPTFTLTYERPLS